MNLETETDSIKITPIKFILKPKKGDKMKVYMENTDPNTGRKVKYGIVRRIELRFNENTDKWYETAVIKKTKEEIPMEQINFFFTEDKVRFL